MSPPNDIRRHVSADDLRGDLVDRSSPLFGVVWANPERMGGTPCFFGTRIPVQTLFDYLVAGDGVQAFRDDFPDVSPDMVADLLRLAGRSLLAPIERAA